MVRVDGMFKTQISQPEPLLLRGREVAHLIGCSRALAYRLMQRGLIPTIRVSGGRTVRVPRDALVAWISANTHGLP
jgi:excisionase family DNA binding protein